MNLAWLPCFHAFSISSLPTLSLPFYPLCSCILSLSLSLPPSLMAMQASLLLTNVPFSISGRPSSKTTILPSSSRSHGKHLSVRASALKEHCEAKETHLYSITPLPLLFLAALPGAGAVRSVFGPIAELVKSWNLPDWLIHWGHPGNMAVVLFAMGGYGTYLGFRIRFSDDIEEKAKAKDLHPKLLGGMFFFFALGATGGITSLLTSDKPIFESPHAVTGFIGLSLLTIQTILPGLFEGNPGLRNVHGILGSGIMALFLFHATLGLQLALATDILLPPRIL